MSCQYCPIPSSCLAWPIFCELARGGDQVDLLHIINRSINNYYYSLQIDPSLHVKYIAIRDCPYREPATKCGCAEATCLQGKGRDGFVVWGDCVQCLFPSG